MREAALILPHSSTATKAIHDALQAELVSVFGGYTSIPTMGSYKGQDGWIVREPSTTYLVAMEPIGYAAFRDIAYRYGWLASQEAVYVRDTEGNVELLSTLPKRPKLQELLRHHVTGAVERGEAEPIEEISADRSAA